MINADTLGKMKPNAILINTSRGPIIDHQALYESLRAGRIGAAALDVTEPEPIGVDSPLLQLDNCIVLAAFGERKQANAGADGDACGRESACGAEGRATAALRQSWRSTTMGVNRCLLPVPDRGKWALEPACSILNERRICWLRSTDRMRLRPYCGVWRRCAGNTRA